MNKTITTIITASLLTGCASVRDAIDKREQKQEAPKAEPAPEAPKPEPKPKPEPSKGEWRTDVADIRAIDGWVRFETKDIDIPTKRNKNSRHGKHGLEYIITRAYGRNVKRLMPMAMVTQGKRKPSRLYVDHNGDTREIDGLWPMPLRGIHLWEIGTQNGVIVVKLDGTVIWTGGSGCTIDGAVMNGYRERECGLWRQVK